MNVTEWLDVCPLSVYSVQSDILHEAKRRENTRLNTHRYLLLQGGTMRFQSADSSFTLHPGDVLFTPSGYHYSYLLSEDARYTNVFFFLHPPAEPIPDSAPFFTDCLYIEKRADFVKMIEKTLREETEHLLADKVYLESVYRAGAEKAAYVANRTLSKVYKKVGFLAR